MVYCRSCHYLHARDANSHLVRSLAQRVIAMSTMGAASGNCLLLSAIVTCTYGYVIYINSSQKMYSIRLLVAGITAVCIGG